MKYTKIIIGIDESYKRTRIKRMYYKIGWEKYNGQKGTSVISVTSENEAEKQCHSFLVKHKQVLKDTWLIGECEKDNKGEKALGLLIAGVGAAMSQIAHASTGSMQETGTIYEYKNDALWHDVSYMKAFQDEEVQYLLKLDEDVKRVNKMRKYGKIVIGIDESYKRTGISIVADGEIKSINSIDFQRTKTNSEKRKILREKLNNLIIKLKPRAEKTLIIVERIRLHSAGFISEDYIKSIGALIAVIVDTAYDCDIPVYSVDTRAWKSKIVGTAKPENNNLYVDPKKYPTIEYLLKKGYGHKLKAYLPENTKIKNYLTDGNGKYLYNDDAADSACIALYGFVKDPKLIEEH